MELGRKITNCRMCESEKLYEFLDLGFLPPADKILSKEDLDYPEIYFPLKVMQCKNCGLTQLKYAVKPEILFGERYSYESSITETGKKHFFEMANSIVDKFNIEKNSLVIDVGSNVGVLLEGFKNKGMNILGIDIAQKIVEIANSRGVETWRGLMNEEISKRIVEQKGKAKVVTATNVFAHIDDKIGFIRGLQILLDRDGILVIESPYLIDLIDNLAYDTIYLDHLEYHSIKPLISFFYNHDMEVFDVERHEIHGNSIRIFVGKKGMRNINGKVFEMLDLEDQKGIYNEKVLGEFAKKVLEHRKKFFDLIYSLKKQGKKIVGISAPAKGNTLLNYCKIHGPLIDYMAEKSRLKLGHYTPGMHIPIIDESQLLEDTVDYGIIFAWNFAEEIIKNNKEFIRRGGKFIIPIPEPIITGGSENLLGVKVEKIDPVFMDERGIISDLLNEKVNHVGLITTEKDAIRANHYHKLSTQYSYILQGKFEVLLAKFDKPDKVQRIELHAGEMITIPPNVIHRFKAIERTIMIDIISESRDGGKYEDDVYRVTLEMPV